AAGVRHVVYTSLTNPSVTSSVSIAPDHRLTEEALAASTVGFTVLRDNLYADLLLGALPKAVADGALYTARGAGRIGYVTREDCARAAAAALADGFDGRRTLDLTGPSSVSGDEIAAIASSIAGKPVAHVPVPPSAYREALIGAGLPPAVADLLVSFEVAAGNGELDLVSTAIRDLTGRAPSSVAEFLEANRTAVTG
ncbi:MAG: NAD(P)-dependent oxidoreductase, partial [Myxococcota bacterium]